MKLQSLRIKSLRDNNNVGKTRGLALRAIERYKPKSLIVAVPYVILKEDWESLLKDLHSNYKVIVVNTLIKHSYVCDMLIVDEVHKFAANTFIDTFDRVKYNKILCLTASLERSDKRHELLVLKAPIIDDISLNEGKRNNWVQPFNIHKIPVLFTKKEEKEYAKISEAYDEVVQVLGSNPMTTAKEYLSYIDRKKWLIGPSGQTYFKKPLFKSLLSTYLFKKFNKHLPPKYYSVKDVDNFASVRAYMSEETYNIAMNAIRSGVEKTYKSPDTEHPTYKMALAAIKFYKIVKQRKSLLYNASNKKQGAIELFMMHKDDVKFILAQEISFLEELYLLLPKENTSIYHSKLTKKQRKTNYDLFLDKTNNVNTLLSAKALLTGIDVVELSTIIITSYSSSNIDFIQTIGRALRYYPGKIINIYYLYIPKTQEETWLKNMNNGRTTRSSKDSMLELQ